VGEAISASKGDLGGHAVRFLSGEILARGDSRTTTMMYSGPLSSRGHSYALCYDMIRNAVLACDPSTRPAKLQCETTAPGDPENTSLGRG
jgi:hypothetical protein